MQLKQKLAARITLPRILTMSRTKYFSTHRSCMSVWYSNMYVLIRNAIHPKLFESLGFTITHSCKKILF